MIYLFLTDGFELVEAMTPIDVLKRAKIDIKTVSISDTLQVNSSSNIKVIADLLFSQCHFSDIEGIILPGGAGFINLLKSKQLLTLIKDCYDKKLLVSAICASPSILDKVGIKEKMTVFPTMKDEISNYISENVVVSNNVITAHAMSSSLDFSLEIVNFLLSEEDKNKISQSVYKN